MRKFSAAFLIYLGLASAALAQNFNMPPPAGVTVGGFVVVTTCGTQSLTAGKAAFATMDTTGTICTVGGSGGSTVQTIPGVSGGLLLYFVQPTASDNHATIKNGPGQVYHVSVTNNSSTINYLRLYNAGTGFNGCNSATNLMGQWMIPSSSSGGAGITFPFDNGLAFSAGISICVTSGYATNDTTSATASAMSVNIGYK